MSNSKSLFLELISILRIRAENFNLATQRLLDKKLENLRSRLLSEEHPVDKVQDFINKLKRVEIDILPQNFFGSFFLL